MLLLGPTSRAEDLHGPPAPPSRPELAAIDVEDRLADVRAAQGAWRWYAGAWSFDATMTALSTSRGGREVNPVFGDRPALVLGAKAAAAAGLWRLEVWSARKGERGLGRFARWLFVGASVVAGGYNLTVAW